MSVKYDTKLIKKCVLSSVRTAYLAIGTANRNVDYEEELVCGAMFKVLEEDNHTHEQFLELLAINHMLQGITHYCAKGAFQEEDMENEDELPF